MEEKSCLFGLFNKKLNFEYVWSFAIRFKKIWLIFSLFMTQMTYLSNEYRGIPQVVMDSMTWRVNHKMCALVTAHA